jgi:SAM-dependent methyltransferase
MGVGGVWKEEPAMKQNKMYDVTPQIAEFYDLSENYTDDVDLIRQLIEGKGCLRILEPFCGTGRILIPLAVDGHDLVGFDQSDGMLRRANAKVHNLSEDEQSRIQLFEADVLETTWPQGFDLVILGGNCLYELATPEDQEQVIANAATALHPGGYVYIDNDHMEGDLDPDWQKTGVRKGWPTGALPDGTQLESTTETIWYDAERRLARFRRKTRATTPKGQVIEGEYIQQKHPVSMGEVKGWLEKQGFLIGQIFGDRQGRPYSETSPRAIFWARKAEEQPAESK